MSYVVISHSAFIIIFTNPYFVNNFFYFFIFICKAPYIVFSLAVLYYIWHVFSFENAPSFLSPGIGLWASLIESRIYLHLICSNFSPRTYIIQSSAYRIKLSPRFSISLSNDPIRLAWYLWYSHIRIPILIINPDSTDKVFSNKNTQTDSLRPILIAEFSSLLWVWLTSHSSLL